LITHERDIAEYADRIITVRDGLIVEDRKNEHKKIGIAGHDDREKI
jgi:ABC-type lipoprotein export system ATPase subunit